MERVCDRIAIDAMLGEAASLKLRIGNVTPLVESALARRGTVTTNAPWFEVAAVADDDVPGIVAELVALGAAIYTVDVARATLEERFIELLERPDAAADDRLAHPA